MITIISGTHRPGSNTQKVALIYQQLLKEKGKNTDILSLEGLNILRRDADFEKIEQEILIPSKAFIIIAPEYNGSFPGTLKLLIDACKPPVVWHNKKVLLTGVSSGRAGNLRGMDHLTGIFNHIKITVHPNKLPLSGINNLLTETGTFKDEATLMAINQQLEEFLAWV
ncbi:MAG: NAD(P)H-dependent oxidoreductase [Chitinophagaceae bacterium]|nr:NAD(P)H-dependent oxidoreductase [Chitinophagaceae bacterium]